MRTLIRGPLIRFEGSPFELGDAALCHHDDGAVVIEDGHFVDVGDFDVLRERNSDIEIVSSDGCLIAPGFVDAHMHYPQIGVIASWGADLLDWLDRFTFPEEGRFGDPEYAQIAAERYFAEQLRHGVTTSASFCTIHPESVDAYFVEADRLNLRAVAGKVMMDRNAPAYLCDTATTAYDESKMLIERWHGKNRLGYAITPRFAPTSTPDQLAVAGALWSERPDCLMQTHLSEQHREIRWVAELFPNCVDYLDVYEQFGLCGAGAVYGHAIHLTDREISILGERGASIAHCPTSNQFLGSGECNVRRLLSEGARVGLSTDTGGGTSYSMFDTMKSSYEVAARRGEILSPAELWWLATHGAAGVLGLGNAVGNIAVGHEADCVLLDPCATPLLKLRTGRAAGILELLFALIILGDDRAVRQVWANGSPIAQSV